MKGVTTAMKRMNQQLNLPQIQKIMSEFEKQSEIMDMKEEMMDDAVNDAIGEGDEETESEQIVQQVTFICRFLNTMNIKFFLLSYRI